MPWDKYAEAYRDGDKNVIATRKTITFLHPMRFYSGREVIILTHKTPVFDESQKIIGISGTVSMISKSNCIQSFVQLNKYDSDLIGTNQSHAPIQYTLYDDLDRFNLSRREVICLFYLIRHASIATTDKYNDAVLRERHLSGKNKKI